VYLNVNIDIEAVWIMKLLCR